MNKDIDIKDVLCHAHDIAANTIEHIYNDLLTDNELAPAHDIELDKIKDCVLILKTVKELKGSVIWYKKGLLFSPFLLDFLITQ